MFTGIITAVAHVTEIDDLEGARRVRISVSPDFLADVAPGDSIAVDGACLTPVSIDHDTFEVDAVLSTLDRTLVGHYRPGTAVNLEKAMVLGGRLDGHLVQGHVDGLGRLEAIDVQGETRFLTFTVPVPVWAQTILHGSITLNGVSLTVHALEPPDRVQVAIIPHTWRNTNFHRLTPHAPVNVEGDLLGKYVGRMLASRHRGTSDDGAPVADR